MILSVGYRVKSREGVHFRRWSNDVLSDYVLKGSAVNERRLAELGQVFTILSRSSDQLASGIAELASAYLPGLVLLHDYDEGSVATSPSVIPTWELTLAEARAVIAMVAAEFPSDTLAGRERGDALEGIIAAVYQVLEEMTSIRRWRRRLRTCCTSWSRTIRWLTAISAVPPPFSFPSWHAMDSSTTRMALPR